MMGQYPGPFVHTLSQVDPVPHLVQCRRALEMAEEAGVQPEQKLDGFVVELDGWRIAYSGTSALAALEEWYGRTER